MAVLLSCAAPITSEDLSNQYYKPKFFTVKIVRGCHLSLIMGDGVTPYRKTNIQLNEAEMMLMKNAIDHYLTTGEALPSTVRRELKKPKEEEQ
jgi:hypothetical protein